MASNQHSTAISFLKQLDNLRNNFIQTILSLGIYKSKEELGFRD